EHGFFVPFGTVHPLLPDWSEDLRRCHEVHGCRGVRLAPGFHGYEITAPEFAECLRQATRRGLVVQVVCSMEDERTQNPQFRVPFVDLARLPEVLAPLADCRLVLLNAFRKLAPSLAAELAGTGKVWFDLAMLEGVDRVGQLVREVGPRPLLWGSHFPLFVPESAQLKLTESELPRPILESIARENAEGLLAARAP
ncbi:MAG: amidohydrolase family protein, partial [Planctomycetaceae bacterium]